ncbi:saccharopine dehydrogenase NADP-binding domain-containing protein [Leptolyngbya sp. FACHB-711]|uniref:saccharopine dehydrogenase family protein n=1 Tax=unclassified Leptolyngbya TaxID=2650499 RepID=UPI001686C49F|nr:saccharopine dehydrogenase NADP-binding domain-containing protein [Leptolyngbya sp. FACHB-711]MBD1853077.1 saccharopine dehydrogenase NADP-binding domain-containing protein [Cyanobacteria bacterium FACHB-502]MBD2023275.1 saccharopine dehydrogenase NADP-binding domain-containing protein [Leptolyngbya sp. FACHB-711]
MTKQVLIVGGRGRIGSSVAADLLTYTDAEVTITGRTADTGHVSDKLGERVRFLELDLSDAERLRSAVADKDLVIHCAGPFRYRDAITLKTCISEGVNYLDVSDDRSFTKNALSLCEAAQQAGTTAVINSGVFPGISNSMVRQGVEQLDEPEVIHLSYVVSGSGGAGVTVMRTTFLGLQNPFQVWVDGRWQEIKPYTGREMTEFPGYGRSGVYWFDMPEAFTLCKAFPVKTVITKFGSVPDYYNRLTWMAAHLFPRQLMRQPWMIEFLSKTSYTMTSVTDRWSGIGVAMRAEVRGKRNGQPTQYVSTFAHENTAYASGCGTGSIAQVLLSGALQKPGVWTVEEALPTHLFEQGMTERKLTIEQQFELPVAVKQTL